MKKCYGRTRLDLHYRFEATQASGFEVSRKQSSGTSLERPFARSARVVRPSLTPAFSNTTGYRRWTLADDRAKTL